MIGYRIGYSIGYTDILYYILSIQSRVVLYRMVVYRVVKSNTNRKEKTMEDMVIQFNGVHLLIVMVSCCVGIAAGWVLGYQTRDEKGVR